MEYEAPGHLCHVILQYLLEYDSGTVDTALDRADGDVHYKRNLVVLMPVDKQPHGLSTSVGEPVHGIAYVVIFACGTASCREHRTTVGVAQLLNGKHSLLAVSLVYVCVAHDCPRPLLEVGAVLEFLLAHQDLQCRVLHKVVRPVAIPGQGMCISQ